MSGNDPDPRARQYARLQRRLERFNPRHSYAISLKNAAEEVMADNLIGSEGTSQEISETILSLLPPPQTVFTAEYFAQPVFPVTLIKDVATLYGCLELDPRILDELDKEKKSDLVLMGNAWFAHAYDPNLERVLMIIDMYETSRIFNPLTLAMPLDRPQAIPGMARGNNRPPQTRRTEMDDPPKTIRTERDDTRGYMVAQRAHGDGSSNHNRPGPSPNDHTRPYGDPTKKATAVEQHFRSSKYNGDLTQSLQNTIRDYNVCAMQLELTPQQKSLFFVNVFGGTARDYFFEHCRDEMSNEQLIDVMKIGFDNNARQLAIESKLENLTLEKVMKDHDIADTNNGMTKLAERINALFPQMPIQSQYPKNKVRFLRKAVLKQDWAKASIAQIVTSNFGFDDLLTSLCEQYQLEQEVHDAKNRSDYISSTLYQQYGRNPKHFYRGRDNSRTFKKPGQKRLNPLGKDGKRMRCSLYGSFEHFVRDCPPGASRTYVRSNLERGVPAVHLCHDLLNGIEELGQSVLDEDAENDTSIISDNAEDARDGSSELHIFDQISNHQEEHDVAKEEELQASFFDKLDGDIATNFISAKIAENADVPAPQILFHSTLKESDFTKDV